MVILILGLKIYSSKYYLNYKLCEYFVGGGGGGSGDGGGEGREGGGHFLL